MEFDISKIPVWELAILGCAAFAILIVITIWYFYGYDMAVIPKTLPSMQAMITAAII